MKEGIVKLSSYSKDVPTNARALVEKTRKNIISGRDHPFTGEILAQNGQILYKKGQIIPDQDLARMNFYVKGVIGKIPQ